MTLSSRLRPRVADHPTHLAVECPFPAAISPHAEALHGYAVEWATAHGLLTTARDTAIFERARFATLISRAYPHAAPADLELAVSWLAVTFALDDYLEAVLGHAPAAQRLLAQETLGYLRGERPAPSPAMADVWTRTTARTTPAWRARFTGHVGEYLAANATEAENRRAGRIPPVAAYLRMRRHTAATALFFDLADALRAEPEPAADPYAEAGLALLRGYADNVVAWFNDLVSWPKEVADGDQHNFVLVVRHERRTTLADAVRYVVDRHDREVRAFVAAAATLRATRPDLDRTIGDLEHWMRANVDWSRESGRYTPEGG